jgi:hypothetical protein
MEISVKQINACYFRANVLPTPPKKNPGEYFVKQLNVHSWQQHTKMFTASPVD